MSDYTQVTDFSAKDGLTTGDAEKAISGADVDGELSAISTAIASKVDEPGSPTTNDVLAWSGSAWAAVNVAVKADMETPTDATIPVTPAVVENHPGVAKAWVQFTDPQANGACTVNASHNCTGVNRDSTGDFTITWSITMADANYCVVGNAADGLGQSRNVMPITRTTTTTVLLIENASGASTNSDTVHVMIMGDL